MSESTYQVGDKVTILDVKKEGEVVSVSEDGSQFSVKFIDDGGAEQTEAYTADKLAKAGEESDGAEGEGGGSEE
jgi:hypothetical protein